MSHKAINRTIIIAEAGVNHNGDIAVAKKLIDVAADAGADFVKFQTFKADKLVSPVALKANYQQRNFSGTDNSQLAMLRNLELDRKAHEELIAHADQKKIAFLSTPFDLDSVDLLADLGVKFFKIPSGEITNLPLIEKIASHSKQVIISTGMGTIDEIKDALDVLISSGLEKEKITVLHCTTEYPTPMADVNLRAMQTISRTFDINVGYSDHTLGIEVPIAAVALGACIIEKHFTLDRTLPGPDHRASLEPTELLQMVVAIRNIETALGSSVKQPSPSEIANIVIARKSIHLAIAKKQGDILKFEDLIMLRPGDGISPMYYRSIIGKKLSRNLPIGTKINLSDLI